MRSPEVAVEIGNPVGVVNGAVAVGAVVVRGPVLGDPQRWGRVVAGESHQQVVQAVRIDLPAAGCGRATRWHEVDIAGTDVAGVVVLVSGSGLDDRGHVVVDAQHVDGLSDVLEVAVANMIERGERLEVPDQVGRVAAEQDGVEEEPVRQRIDAAGGVDVSLGIGGRRHGREIERQPELLIRRALLPERVEGQAVAEQEVMDGADSGDRFMPAGGMHPGGVAEQAGAEGLVEGGPMLHPVPQASEHAL